MHTESCLHDKWSFFFLVIFGCEFVFILIPTVKEFWFVLSFRLGFWLSLSYQFLTLFQGLFLSLLLIRCIWYSSFVLQLMLYFMLYCFRCTIMIWNVKLDKLAGTRRPSFLLRITRLRTLLFCFRIQLSEMNWF